MITLCRDCFISEVMERRCRACGSPRLLRHSELLELNIAHLDCDAFYASVEKRDRPELRDKPVIVGGGVRGVVTTCCYIARMSGVRSAMPMFKALKACPQAVVIKPDFSKYRADSKRIMAMMQNLTPLVQPLALDEAWMDLSGTLRLHGAAPATILARLQAQIEREVGITVSIGLAPNKFLAKIASDLDKPRGYSVIGRAEAKAFLAERSVGILPGVGPAMVKSLEACGMSKVSDIARADLAVLGKAIGPSGLRLHRLAQGQDDRSINVDQVRKSISAETTFNTDLKAFSELDDHLVGLAERVGRQARGLNLTGRVVTLKLRASDFKILTRRRALALPTQTSKTILAVGRELLQMELQAGARGRAFRLIGVGLSDLTEAHAGGDDLFGQDEQRHLASERAADTLRKRFGPRAVTSGRALGRKSPPAD